MAAKNIKTIRILGIDTSCDDTCLALVEYGNHRFKILSNVISSQAKLHQKYGGVYPLLAKREHQKNLPIVFGKVDDKAFDLIGVTEGPGLEPCLWQGINFTQNLARKFKKPVIPVNHIEAHILANLISRDRTSIKFPAICLVVSGGHTGLILMKGVGKYQLIGETRDDAAGECLDKAARILGLGYPGGPIIAKLAENIRGSTSFNLPRPMMLQKNYDFSFSGLKTAVLYKVRSGKSQVKNKRFVEAMCAETQQAVIDVLIHKTIKAAKDFRAKSIILGGGVAANTELRKQFKSKIRRGKLKIQFLVPRKIFCTDNAAMVAATAFFHRKNIRKNIKAQANLKI
jgi:N6-L-threonylcarbamoyladenine synthase